MSALPKQLCCDLVANEAGYGFSRNLMQDDSLSLKTSGQLLVAPEAHSPSRLCAELLHAVSIVARWCRLSLGQITPNKKLFRITGAGRVAGIDSIRIALADLGAHLHVQEQR